MLPYIAVVIIVLFVAAAFAIDIASIHVVRSELRTATDAAARAGVEALGRQQSASAAVTAALDVANANVVAGQGLTLERSNIIVGAAGRTSSGVFSFDPNGSPLNAVRVTGERTNASPDGSVGLFFGPILGVSEFQPVQTATATRLDRDIALVLDVSGSMRINGRFQALQRALDVFLTELNLTSQRERISLTVYSSDERLIQQMTPDLQLIRDAFANEMPEGSTAIGQGLESGLDSVLRDPESRAFALKSIVVMTDGNQNAGVGPDVIAQLAADEDVTVSAITFSAGANQTLMEDVARIGGGLHLHADDNDELVDAFRTIARQLQVLLIQ